MKQQTVTKDNRKMKNSRKVKAMGNITPTMDHIPEMDRWEMPILNFLYHFNPGNE